MLNKSLTVLTGSWIKLLIISIGKQVQSYISEVWEANIGPTFLRPSPSGVSPSVQEIQIEQKRLDESESIFRQMGFDRESVAVVNHQNCSREG